MTVAVRVCRGV